MRMEEMGADPELYDRLSDLVDEADTDEDLRLIREVLASDASAEARTVATLLLVNFMDDDASWHALVGSAIDPVAQVSSVAMSMLSAFVSGRAPTVDWSGARDPLSAVLAGTNPFAFTGEPGSKGGRSAGRPPNRQASAPARSAVRSADRS